MLIFYPIIFFIILLIGVVIGKIIIGNNDSFLPHLLSFFSFFIGYFYFTNFSTKKLLEKLNSYYLYIEITFWFLLIIQIYNNYFNLIYKSGYQSHLFIYGILLAIISKNRNFTIYLIYLAALVLLSILIKKNTSLILLIFSIIYSRFYTIRFNKEILVNKFRFFLKYFILFLVVIILYNINDIIILKEKYLPFFSSGNIYNRYLMMELGYYEFLDSPLFGNFFTSSSVIDFIDILPTITITSYVPIHNDYLMVLSNGGIFSFIILMLILFFPFKYKNIILNDLKFCFNLFYFSFFLYSISSIFNPNMSDIGISSLAWFNLGLVYSIIYISLISYKDNYKNQFLININMD